MKYLKAGGENLPFPDDYFDTVSSFNALDHVESVDQAVAEAQRVLAPGGDFLLIVEVDHKPTVTEPHNLTESVLNTFKMCEIIWSKTFEINAEHNIYGSLSEARPRLRSDVPGVLCAHLRKKP